MTDDQEEIKYLQETFNFVIEIEPKDIRVMYMKFKDGRQFRLEHCGALMVAKIFSKASETLSSDCLEFFIKSCILPIANTETKTLNLDNMDIDETMELWLPFAWRFLRRGHRIVMD